MRTTDSANHLDAVNGWTLFAVESERGVSGGTKHGGVRKISWKTLILMGTGMQRACNGVTLKADKAIKRVAQESRTLLSCCYFHRSLVKPLTPGERMIAAIEAPIGTEQSWQISGDGFKAHEPTNWTCYNAGEATPAWVVQAAENDSTPLDILEMLAESCNVAVRMAVADNHNASLDILMMFARDESVDLRYQVAENHNIDESVLKLLADDSHPYVASRAQKTLRRLQLKGGAVILPFPILIVAPEPQDEPLRRLKRMEV